MLAAVDIPDSVARRLFIADRLSGKKFLVDTGADVSVIPAVPKERRNKSKYTLCAANGTPIATFGQKLLQLDFGLRRSFQWPFCIAAVSKHLRHRFFIPFQSPSKYSA